VDAAGSVGKGSDLAVRREATFGGVMLAELSENGIGYVYVLGVAYVVATTAFIISENRRPQATFAWMLLFFSLPGAGVVLYLLFGRNRRVFSRQRRLAHQVVPGRPGELLAELGRQHDRALARMEHEGGPSARLARLVRHNAHSVITTRNRVEVLQDAVRAYPRLIDDLRNARRFVHLQTYSWASDQVGAELKAILCAKAAEGVEVRVLYDPLGSLLKLNPFYRRAMRNGGVRMEPYAPLWRLHTIGYRNHRKIAVIDGEVGYTGGLNIGHEHLEPGPGFDGWRDTHLRIVGSAASALQAVFATDWQNAVGGDLLGPEYLVPGEAAPNDGAVPVQVTVSGPDSQWAAIRQLYFAMIMAARHTIRIQSPFFVLDVSIAEALKAAALAGTDVQVMLSERGVGQWIPYWAANTYAAEVARAGVKVHLYRPGYLHAKTICIDGEICSIGSANMDIRSFSINYELNAVIYDRATAQELEAAFDRDLAACALFDPDEYRRRPWPLRFRDSVTRLGSPLL
jgi:cardiolipin synthase